MDAHPDRPEPNWSALLFFSQNVELARIKGLRAVGNVEIPQSL